MRILLLSTYFQPDITANGILMTQLAEGLAELGHELTVVTTMPHYDRNRIWEQYRGRLFVHEPWGRLDVRRIYLYVPKRKQNLAGRALGYATFNILSTAASVLAGKHDVMLTPSPPLTNGIAALLVSRLYGVPFIYNTQDIYPDVAIRLGVLKNRAMIAMFRAMERFVYRQAAAVSVISEGFRRNLLAKGVPDHKIHVIPNFVDTDLMAPQPRHNGFSREHGLDDRFTVLFAGNVGLSQGLESVLEAAQLTNNLGDVLYLIVGNGAAKADLEAQAQQMHLTNVAFLPFQPQEMVPEMYASADVCLVPLRHGLSNDSVPSKVFTIQGAARPLIAAVDQHSDTWDYVQSAGCGLCIEPEDPAALSAAICTLRSDGSARQQMGARGRQYVLSKYTREAVVQQYASLLEKVGGHTGRQHS
jgi:colanic acid biosynthesis glycosyl transferase WcaI